MGRRVGVRKEGKGKALNKAPSHPTQTGNKQRARARAPTRRAMMRFGEEYPRCNERGCCAIGEHHCHIDAGACYDDLVPPGDYRASCERSCQKGFKYIASRDVCEECDEWNPFEPCGREPPRCTPDAGCCNLGSHRCYADPTRCFDDDCEIGTYGVSCEKCCTIGYKYMGGDACAPCGAWTPAEPCGRPTPRCSDDHGCCDIGFHHCPSDPARCFDDLCPAGW